MVGADAKESNRDDRTIEAVIIDRGAARLHHDRREREATTRARPER
jgi:hypothetical protein